MARRDDRQQLSHAATQWQAVAAAMRQAPTDIGMTAGPEVYEALTAVAGPATRLNPKSMGSDEQHSNATYVEAMSNAFAKAIEVCTRVGVINP